MMKWFAVFAVFTVVCGSFVWTSQWLPLTWDEGEYIDRAVCLTAKPQRESLPPRWEGHPFGFVGVIAVGHAVAPSCLPEKTRWRFGPILLAALAITCAARRIRLLWGTAAAVFAVLSMVMIPRLFGHWQLAGSDSVLISSWLLFWCFASELQNPFLTTKGTNIFTKNHENGGRFVSFVQNFVWFVVKTLPALKHCRSLGFAILSGGCLGLAMSSKFTGFLVPIPFILWLIFWVRPNREGWKTVAVMFFVAVAVFYGTNPFLWESPIHGFVEFVQRNLSRDGYNIAVLYGGEFYDLNHPLPVTNTLVWVAITTPLGLLGFAAVAIFRYFLPMGHSMSHFLRVLGVSVRENCFTQRHGVHRVTVTGIDTEHRKTLRLQWIFLVLNVSVLLVVRAIPGTPPHDGVRLFIAAFPFIGIISGIGASVLWNSVQRRSVMYLNRVIVVMVFVVSFGNVVWYSPQWLSFYNGVIGGLSGATAAGFEPTYYWDSLDSEVFDWIHANTDESETIYFSAISPKLLRYQTRWGVLQRPYRIGHPPEDSGGLYILQRRPSGETERDRELIATNRPVFSKTIRCSDVPLLEIYDLRK